jgi:4-hydroxybenzoate polyprenyltransferase
MLSQKIKALLATARIANVPSVVSNVFTGIFLAITHYINPEWDRYTIFPILASICLYIAGNFLNDWYDTAWDLKNRPERAIPSGLFARSRYLSIAIILAICGLCLVLSISYSVTIIYTLIAMLVVLYTLLHKKHSYSIWIMGACRGGLYLMGIAAMVPGNPFAQFFAQFFVCDYSIDGFISSAWLPLPVLGLICYIAGISLMARYESSSHELPNGFKIFASMLLLLPCMTHSCLLLERLYKLPGIVEGRPYAVLGILPFLAYTGWAIWRNACVGKKVGRFLAGIPLVDSVFVFCLCLGLFEDPYFFEKYAMIPLIPILCFFSALLLQKIAPAT